LMPTIASPSPRDVSAMTAGSSKNDEQSIAFNRLVVAVRGSQVQSWINGSLISSVQVDVGNPGAVVFFDSNQDATPSATNLSDLYVFAPGN